MSAKPYTEAKLLRDQIPFEREKWSMTYTLNECSAISYKVRTIEF